MEAGSVWGEGRMGDPNLTTWTRKVKSMEVPCSFPFAAAINDSRSHIPSLCRITLCSSSCLEDLAFSSTQRGWREFYCPTGSG